MSTPRSRWRRTVRDSSWCSPVTTYQNMPPSNKQVGLFCTLHVVLASSLLLSRYFSASWLWWSPERLCPCSCISAGCWELPCWQLLLCAQQCGIETCHSKLYGRFSSIHAARVGCCWSICLQVWYLSLWKQYAVTWATMFIKKESRAEPSSNYTRPFCVLCDVLDILLFYTPNLLTSFVGHCCSSTGMRLHTKP